MRHSIDASLIQEASEFSLRFRCEHCAHFDDVAPQCSLGYPTDEHRQRPLLVGHLLCFCKEFELV